MTSIPLADAAALRPAARRTLAIRIALAAALAGLIVAMIVVSRHPHTQTIVTLPAHSSAIVVLDVSASISSDTYSRIGATLSSLARSNGRYGLVVFSDQAYEALPPGTTASDLAPLVRYFTLPPAHGGFAQTFPPNPWARSFSAGTKISAGLSLAHQIAFDDRLSKPVVVLVSDLDDDPEDVYPRLVTVTAALKRDRIPLRIVGLNPSSQDFALFKKLTGGAPIVRAGLLEPGPQLRNHTPFPWTLVALALLVAVLIAVHELWGPRLEWRPES
jgi:von Willebrand factor type A domain